ncbi:hypothetical protein B0G75_101742 [Paraburkholderia sp. BL18I3N2]|nr:hypothetical protein B0G75_101742 [Paraburkholderia sp. BL18I3N2]
MDGAALAFRGVAYAAYGLIRLAPVPEFVASALVRMLKPIRPNRSPRGAL